MPEFCEHDWATRHFANWKAWTSVIAGAPGVRVLEIGSFEGRSAVWWMENVCTHETARLVCVDTWNWKAWPDSRARFERNLQPWGKKVEVYLGESRKALADFADETFDVVYVDGSHEGRDACLDVLMSVPLVRVGGLLICDDYDWKCEGLVAQPRQGYEAAFELNVDRLHLFHCEYQMAFRRIK